MPRSTPSFPLFLSPTLASLALALLPACGGDGSAAESPALEDTLAAEPIVVRVEPVRRDTVVAVYATSATLRAEARATVTSRTRGVLEELLVEEGDAVELGQTIAKLEDDEQLLAVARTETVEDIKRRELERALKLNADRILSDNEVELLRREVEELKHELALARLNLERTTILAPFDGVVVQRYLDVGATVSDGTPIYDLADLDPLYVDVNVPERHVARLAAGQTVRLGADAVTSPLEARIERIAPVVDAATGTVKVTVAVERSVVLRPGAFVQIEVVTDVHADALVVPRSALVAEGRRWLVYRADERGESVAALEVERGFEEGDRVEILATLRGEALRAGDRVVALGAAALSDGARIKLREHDEAAPDPVSNDSAPGDDESAARAAKVE